MKFFTKNLWISFLASLPVLLFALFLFGFTTPAKASDVLDLSYTNQSDALRDYDGWTVFGARFTPNFNNLSKMDFYLTSGTDTSLLTSWDSSIVSYLTICSGSPSAISKANVEANGPTCGWSGNVQLLHIAFVPTVIASNYSYFVLPTPLALTVGANYFWILTYGSPTHHFESRFGSGTLGIINEGAGPNIPYRTYYSTTYTPPATGVIYLTLPKNNTVLPYNSAIYTSFAYEYKNPAMGYTNSVFELNNITASSTLIQFRNIASTTASTTAYFVRTDIVPGSWRWRGWLSNLLTGSSTAMTNWEYFQTVSTSTFQNIIDSYGLTASTTVSTSTLSQFMFGTLNILTFACTPDELSATSTWASQLWCTAKVGGLTLVLNVAGHANDIFHVAVNLLANLFPFSIGVSVYNSWTNSATASMPSDLAFLDITDGAGNIYLTIPTLFTGNNSTTTRMLVFGTAVFTQESTMTNFFAHMRIFSTYLMYILFLLGIYARGHDFYEEVKGH